MQVYIRQYWARPISLRGPPFTVKIPAIFHDSRFQKFPYDSKEFSVRYVMCQHLHQPFVVYIVKESPDVCLYHIIRLLIPHCLNDLLYCLVAIPVWSESIALVIKLRLINLFQYLCNCVFHQFILVTGYAQRPHFAFRLFRNINPSCWIWAVASALHSLYKILKVFFQILSIFFFCHSVYAAGLVLIHSLMDCFQASNIDIRRQILDFSICCVRFCDVILYSK